MRKNYRIILISIVLAALVLIFLFYSPNNLKKNSPNEEPLIQNNQIYESFGLPADSLSNKPDFITFISSNNESLQREFYLVSSGGLSLVELLGAGEGSGQISVSANPYFSDDGHPIFFKSDPLYHGEKIEYNNSGSYALERSISEPDASISLWDINNKKVSSVALCGTACGFSGMYWLSDSKFVVYGVERGYGEGAEVVADSRFVRIYDLSENTMTAYSDKK